MGRCFAPIAQPALFAEWRDHPLADLEMTSSPSKKRLLITTLVFILKEVIDVVLVIESELRGPNFTSSQSPQLVQRQGFPGERWTRRPMDEKNHSPTFCAFDFRLCIGYVLNKKKKKKKH